MTQNKGEPLETETAGPDFARQTVFLLARRQTPVEAFSEINAPDIMVSRGFKNANGEGGEPDRP